jgi:hypothetical protein
VASTAAERGAQHFVRSMLNPKSFRDSSERVPVSVTWTRRSGTSRVMASSIAHSAAVTAALDPSMPTPRRSSSAPDHRVILTLDVR